MSINSVEMHKTDDLSYYTARVLCNFFVDQIQATENQSDFLEDSYDPF